MSFKSSGSVSISEINTFLNRTSTITTNLSQLYRNGSLITSSYMHQIFLHQIKLALVIFME
jgi:hypothetical protein